jgi:YVTN family beta-propeller protein
VLSTERLVDELWGERPPATASKSIHVYVSRLRKALGENLLVRHGPGYLLRLEPDQLDLYRFERLLEEGRELLSAGEPKRAAETLRAALSLWRGPALTDFVHEQFAQSETNRLEDLRTTALEEQVAAGLALGRAAGLVSDLERLVREHPLRERLRGQLMLALYQSGRQAEALEAYRAGRRELLDQLGLEPSPALQELERAILVQDPALLAQTGSGVLARARRAPRLLSAVGAILLAAAISGAVLALARSGAAPGLAAVAPNSVGAIDPRTNKIVAEVPVGARPAAEAAGDGALWIANSDDETVSRVDPRTTTVVRTLPIGSTPTGLAFGAGAVWVATFGGRLGRIDPQYNAQATVANLSRDQRLFLTPVRRVAVGLDAVWVVYNIGVVYRIDPVTHKVLTRIDVGRGASDIAVGAGYVWVADTEDGTVSRIDSTNAVTTVPVGHGPSAIAVGEGAVWVVNQFDGTLVRINPQTSAPSATIAIGPSPVAVAVGGGAVWVADSQAGTVSRIDPKTNTVAKTITVGNSPSGLTYLRGSLWVTVAASPPRPAATIGGIARFDLQEDPGTTDPTLSPSFQLEYAVCAKLVNYPDKPAPEGSQLEPEAAQSLPAVSADGKTYTFTIRPGFRFSPPSNAPVTAESFRYSIERALNPAMNSPAIGTMTDVVGFQAYGRGKAQHIAGLTAKGNRLTITLLRPAGDLPARMALPSFCAVPVGTPIAAKGLPKVPTAGPYYVASYTPNQQIVLKRNPNYRGRRPHRLAEIDYAIDVGQAQTVSRVEAGTSDYAADGVPPEAQAGLESRYGPGSSSAKRGRQQYFVNPVLLVRYLMLNTSRPPFSDRKLRQAANYAIDRPALIAQLRRFSRNPPGAATAEYLPPGMPGYRNAHVYPLNGPDLPKARALAGGKHRTAVLYTCNQAPCPQLAQIIRTDLEAIGIDVEIRQFPIAVMYQKAGRRGEPFDIISQGWVADYPDPFDFLNLLFSGDQIHRENNFSLSYLDDPVYNQKLAVAAKLSGAKRYRVYSELADELARKAAPAVAYENDTSRDFFSARVGCQLYQPIYGMDIAALCVRNPRR